MLKVVQGAAGKVRDIRSAVRRVASPAAHHRSQDDHKVIDLRAYTGRNVIRFPRRGPNGAA
ncbi:hypothetical protein J5X84_23815 [Streptosporangiaceae bacterium NEAU-GS5]|nr:hypothetical protein [Streptosporangiaceae bacterium NEAU-GS5]